MGDFLRVIFDHLKEFWPIRIVTVGHQGLIRSPNGSIRTLMPGWHWFFPGFQDIIVHSVMYSEVDCELQTVETEDGVAVTFSANVGYQTVDIATAWQAVHDMDTTLERAVRGYLGSLVSTYTYEDLKDTRGDVIDQAREALEELTAEWGIKIVRVRLTDFVRTRSYRLFGGHAGEVHNL